MDATLTNTWPHAELGTGLGRWTESPIRQLETLASRMSRVQRVVAISIMSGLILLAGGMTGGPGLVGYLSVFGLSVLTNAILFIPSGRGAIMLAAAMVLNPFAVAILSGVGGGLGEITGYALGRSSRTFGKKVRLPSWLSGFAESHMGIIILAASIIPNPFVDFIGILAGRLVYPVQRFLVFTIIGKVIQCVGIVYLAIWNASLVSSWLNTG